MDTQSDFEREIAARVDRVESALLALARKVEALGSGRPNQAASARPWAASASGTPQSARPKVAPRLRSLGQPAQERGVDWWLARAGAGLTVVAVILLYQYAVEHGWITPWVRVLTGALVGAGLMWWGRKMAPPEPTDAVPVALRELMMGAALAIWYITAFAASSRYHLVAPSASRYVFLVLSIVGATLSLKERRSGIALLAVTAGFIGPMILSDSGAPFIPTYAFYLVVLGAMSVILYLMRGWQSVLWVSFFALSMTLSLPVFDTEPVILTVIGLAMAIAYTRAPALRRALVATGADRYTEPVRSRFATHWLSETGRFFRMFSPAAGSLDSLSVWIVTLVAPLLGLSFLASAWPLVNDAVWGALAIGFAVVAYRMCTSGDENGEITHVKGAASLVWATFGTIGVTHALLPVSMIDHGTASLAIIALAAAATLSARSIFEQPRFVAALAAARLMAAVAVLRVLFEEAGFQNLPVTRSEDPIRVVASIAELIGITAGVIAWRDMRRRGIGGGTANLLILMSYAALLLVDARVLGAIWTPLVTATFAMGGTALLIMSRKGNNKLMRAVGGATLALVMFRLFIVDMAGVDTIWRVFLFLGVGALFLFTSRQLQVAKPAPFEST